MFGEEIECRYLDETSNAWMKDGCVGEIRRNVYVCICNHLTKFSITSGVQGYLVQGEDVTALGTTDLFRSPSLVFFLVSLMVTTGLSVLIVIWEIFLACRHKNTAVSDLPRRSSKIATSIIDAKGLISTHTHVLN